MIVVNKFYKDDGVAPQCSVPGLDWLGSVYARVLFQGLKDHLNFIDAHLINNYEWVTNIEKFRSGYVRARY